MNTHAVARLSDLCDQRGACIRCILYTAVVMYTSTSPPLPTLSDVYVYVLYTYTKICPHVCTMYAFYTAEIHQKQGIFLMYATENDVYIKLLYARVYVERQHRGSYRGSVSRLVLGLVSKLHGGYIEASRLVAILVAMSHPIIPLGCTLARCPRGASRQGAGGARAPQRGATQDPGKHGVSMFSIGR